MTSVDATWWGPIGLEGQKTGDGRTIELNALTWGEFPLPLRWAPEDYGAHDGAKVVGRILGISRDKDGRLIGFGDFDMDSEHGREAQRHVTKGLTPGVSMDLDDILLTESEDGQDLTITQGRVRGATLVAIPAFADARLSSIDVSTLADEPTDPTQETPEADVAEAVSLAVADSAETATFNWVEDAGGLPKYVKRIATHLKAKGMDESHAIAVAVNVVKKMCASGDVNFPGAQQVNAKSRAEACAAVAEWEAKKAKAKVSGADTEPFSLTAAAYPRSFFDNPGLSAPTPLTVDDDGHVYGHIALWGTCHIGFKGCTQPPNSPSNYAYFNTHEVTTDDGRRVAVGRLTMNTLHAGQRLSANDTVYHYEHTGAVGAYVRAGEDQHGIWVSGVAHPKADIDALRAAPVSGDWRRIGSGLELVGLLSVNVPGFPVPRPQALVASGEVMSLVAGGMNTTERRTTLAIERVKAMVFGYNKDQWRVPKGNGEISGRWVDMPDVSLTALMDTLMDLADRGVIGEDRAPDIGEAMDKAQEASSRITAAIEAADGDGARAAAEEASEHLSLVEAQLQDLADNGDGLSEDEMTNLGERLTEARDSVDLVKDSDLSLLGDEGIGGDDPTGDIGADEPEIGDVDTPAPGDDDSGKEAIWKGFEDSYLQNADPEEDVNPDTLREQYDADIAAGSTPEEAIANVAKTVQDNRNPGTPDAREAAREAISQDSEGPIDIENVSGDIIDFAKDADLSPAQVLDEALDLWIGGESSGWKDLDRVFDMAEANELSPQELKDALGLSDSPATPDVPDADVPDVPKGSIDFEGVNPDGTIPESDNENDWPEAEVLHTLPVGSVVSDDSGYEFTKTALGEWEVSKEGPSAAEDDLPLGTPITEQDVLAGGDSVLAVKSVGPDQRSADAPNSDAPEAPSNGDILPLGHGEPAPDDDGPKGGERPATPQEKEAAASASKAVKALDRLVDKIDMSRDERFTLYRIIGAVGGLADGLKYDFPVERDTEMIQEAWAAMQSVDIQDPKVQKAFDKVMDEARNMLSLYDIELADPRALTEPPFHGEIVITL